MKIMTVVGTRPEIIRLSRVIAKLDQFAQHILVHTGQNYDYELNKIFFEDLGIRKPDYFLESAKGSVAASIGSIITELDQVLIKENPKALLVLGDTNSCLSVIPAKRRKIPIFHMEAGNRCFDQRVPEEINRKIVDHTSDINMPYSSVARDYLLREGFPPDQIIKIGSPMYEVLEYYKERISQSDVLERHHLTKENYFVVSTHREENVDEKESLVRVSNVLNRIADIHDCPIILSTHPRTRKRLDSFEIELHPLVKDLKPLGFLDYIKLQQNAFCVISDSGTITEESSILNFPAISLREVHERPEGMEEASVVMNSIDIDTIKDTISVATNMGRGENRTIELVEDYYSPNVSDKVLRIIYSYTSFVNKRVWHE